MKKAISSYFIILHTRRIIFTYNMYNAHENVYSNSAIAFFAGEVTKVLSGTDGNKRAKYVVKDQGEDGAEEVSDLISEYKDGTLKILN